KLQVQRSAGGILTDIDPGCGKRPIDVAKKGTMHCIPCGAQASDIGGREGRPEKPGLIKVERQSRKPYADARIPAGHLSRLDHEPRILRTALSCFRPAEMLEANLRKGCNEGMGGGH